MRSGLAGAALILAGLGQVHAAEVGPGGTLDVSLSGFAAFRAHGGALDNLYEERLSTGPDLSNDTELHVLVRGRHEATGLDYGGTVELEADTNRTENAGESWLFVRGGFGELRLGDEDGPVDGSAIGASTIAAGTGGIDGEVIDALVIDAVLPTSSAEATKIRYYTPSFAGFQAGVSYAPNVDAGGDSLATDEVAIGDWVEAALVYEGEIGERGIAASIVGSLGDAKESGSREVWAWYAGATGELPWIEAALGFGMEDMAGRRKRYVNAGVAQGIGPVYASLTAGLVLDSSGYEGVGEPWNVVLSANRELMPGVVLATDIALFDNDLDRDLAGETGGDDGIAWLVQLALAF